MEKALRQINDYRRLKTETEKAYEKLNNIIERDLEKIAEKEELERILKQNDQEMTQTQTIRRYMHELIELQDELSLQRDLQYDLSQSYNIISTKYDKAEKHYYALYNMYIENVSYMLSKKLIEGTACPVCGSKTHPHHKHVPSEIVSIEDIQKERLSLDQLLKEKRNIENSILENTSKIKNLESRINLSKSKIDIEDLDKETLTQQLYLIDRSTREKEKRYTRLSGEITYLNKLIFVTEDNIKRRNDLKKSIMEYDAMINELEESLNKGHR